MPPPVALRDRSTFVRPLVVLAAIVTLVLTLAPSASAAGTFVDDDQSVHENDIEWIAAKGITQGCNPPTNNRYCPGDNVTRGQMAAYLERALDMGNAPSAGFTDTSGSIFEGDIDAIAQSGITKGCNPPGNDRYCPGQVVTRGQMAAFLTRAFGLEATNVDYFGDDNASTFENDINAVAAAGVSVGCGSDSYCPDDPVTREQMASFIKRAIAGGITPPSPSLSPSEPSPPPKDLPPPGDSKPAGAVVVDPGDNLSSIVKSHPKNTTFYLTSGIHRLTGINPKSGNEFVGAPGAVISGARVLNNFSKDGSHWVASGQTQRNEQHGNTSTRCEDGYNGCLMPEQLFIDNVELWQVTSRSQLKSGTWYFDYGADKIYLADNPSGHLVETSITPHAFIGKANNVTIRDLTIEKYATPASMGAIHGRDGRVGPHNSGWKVIGNEIRYSASNGVHFGDDMVVKNNYIHHNGRLGIGSSASQNALAEGNEISHNCVNTGFKCFGWGGGGVKFAGAIDAVMRGNYVHHNVGPGVHDDEGTTGSVYENNLIVANDGHGIMIEISFDALVRDNTIRDNGYNPPIGRGAGIRVNSSRNTDVTGNVVRNNAAGIVGWEAGRPPYLHDLTVTGNTVFMNGGWSGLSTGSGSINFDSRGVAWNNNTYDIDGLKKPFVLNGTRLTPSGWRSNDYDTNSKFK